MISYKTITAQMSNAFPDITGQDKERNRGSKTRWLVSKQLGHYRNVCFIEICSFISSKTIGTRKEMIGIYQTFYLWKSLYLGFSLPCHTCLIQVRLLSTKWSFTTVSLPDTQYSVTYVWRHLPVSMTSPSTRIRGRCQHFFHLSNERAIWKTTSWGISLFLCYCISLPGLSFLISLS